MLLVPDSRHTRADRPARVSEAQIPLSFAQIALDALPVEAAQLDRTGVVTVVNRAWNCSTLVVAGLRRLGPGADYLGACRTAPAPEAAQLARGIEAVLDGSRSEFRLECLDRSGRRISVQVTSLVARLGALVTYETDPFERLPERCDQPSAGLVASSASRRDGLGRRVPVPALYPRERNAASRDSGQEEQAGDGADATTSTPAESGAGQLASVAADRHDLANLLVALGGIARLMLTGASGDDSARAHAAQLVRGLEDAECLTREMGRPARKPRTKVTDVNALLDDLSATLTGVLDDSIELVTTFSATRSAIHGDRQALARCILNLAINARDAMPRGGVLRIESTDVVVGTAHTRVVPGLAPGPHVLVTVADTGAGMDEDVLARAFEPHFSTKDRRSHSGLGLASVRECIERLGGRVTASSDPGGGCTFHIYLPCVTPDGALLPTAASLSGDEADLAA